MRTFITSINEFLFILKMKIKSRSDCLAWYREMQLRHEIRSIEIPDSAGPDPDIYQVHVGAQHEISFLVKKSKFDAWNSLYTFQGEEGIRRDFFYPYLPCNFIDAGACLGSWTLPALAKGSTVYGFESDIRYLQDLVKTIEINRFPTIFFGFPMALYEISDAVIVDMGEIQNVQTISIDDFVQWNNLRPEYIKIDVEGLEQSVIKGSMRVLEKFKPKVLVENHEWANKDITDWIKVKMESIGYSYKDVGRISGDVSYSFFI